MSDDVGEAGSAGRARESDAWSQCLADTVPDGVCRLDGERRLAAVNDALLEVTGHARADLLGEHHSVLFEGTDLAKAELAVRRGADGPVGVALSTADGEQVPCTLRVGRPDDDADAAVCVLRPRADGEPGSVRTGADAPDGADASGDRREDARGALRRDRDLIERILDAAPVRISVIDPDGEIVRTNGYTMAELGTAEPDRVGDREIFDEDGTYLPPGERPYMRVFETGEPVYGEQVQAETATGDRRWLSVNAVPIREDGEVARVVVALEDVTELKERSRRLREERNRFESELDEVFERITDGFYALDEEWRFTYVNEEAEHLVGRDEEELLGESIWEAFPEAAESRIRREYERAFESQETVSFEEYYEPLEAWFAIDVYPSETGLSVYFRDVTERKEHEQRLEATTARLEALFENSPDMIDVLDPEGTILDANERLCAELGYAEAELLGSRIWEIDRSLDADDVKSLLADVDVDESRKFDTRYERRDGSTFPVEVNLVRLDIEGRDRFIAISRDITERKRRERELREERDMFADGPAVVFRWRADEEAGWPVEYVSKNVEDVLGYAPAELESGEVPYTDLLLEEELDRIASEVEENSDETTERFSHEPYRVVTKDGDVRWVKDTTKIIRDETGEITHYLGYLVDVTERKEHERELEQYEAITETIHDGICVLNGDSEFVTVNDAFVELTGYSREELLGAPASLVRPEALDERFEEIQAALAGESEIETVEMEIETADGRRRVIDARYAGFPHEDGFGRVGVWRDVTERRERERDLAQYRALIQAATDVIVTIDEGSTIQSVNPAVEEMFGYERDELLGESLTKLMPERFTEGHLEALERYRETGERTLDWEYVELPGQRADGSEVPLAISFGETEYGGERYFTGIVRDVTERKERERELERYERIVENVPVGVYRNTPGPEGEFVEANPAIAEIFDADSVEEFTQHTTSELYPDPEQRKAFSDRLEREGVVEDVELKQETLEGNTIWISVTAIKVEEEGEVYFDGIVQDITERRRFQKALQALHVTTRNLFRAETHDRIGWLVAEATRDVLDVTDAAVYLHDEDRDVLSPVADIDTGGEPVADLPDLPHDGESLVSRVYENDEIRNLEEIGPGELEGLDLHSGMLVSLGEHGVLVAGSSEPGGLDEGTRRLLSVLSENARVAFDRVDRERELEESRRRYETLAENFPNGVVTLFDRDLRYILAGGEGFEEYPYPFDPEDIEGEPVEECLPESLLEQVRPEFEAALEGEIRAFEVELGDRTLQFHAVPVRDEDGEVFAGIGMSQDITDQREREREIRRQRERLAALNHINAIVREVIQALLGQSTRGEIEQLVCDHLTESSSYEFAWVGEVEEGGDEVVPRAVAGADDSLREYLDETTITVDESTTGRGPTGRALRTGEVQVSQRLDEDPDFEPWADAAVERGFRASAAVPIAYENTVYGVLNVYTERPDAFDGEEQAVVEQLGAVMGHAINAAERERVLMSDEVIQIDFRMPDVFEAVEADGEAAGRIDLNRTVPVGGDDYLVYGTATQDGVETLETLVEELPHWTDLAMIGDDYGGERFELRLTEPPATSLVAAHGGHVKSATIEEGAYRMTVELPADADVREVVEGVQEAYPGMEVLAQRHTTADDRSVRTDLTLSETLTDRQQAALQAAYFAGFFEWPRASTGEEVADAIGVSAPTFHQHLRAAERRLLGAIIEGEDPQD